MILLTVIFSVLTVVCFVITLKLSSNGNCWAALTAIGFVVFLVLSARSHSEITPNTYTIPEVKAVQIDTVITTHNHISDTTYVIHYTK